MRAAPGVMRAAVGVVLAAGAGRRMGTPKALVSDERGGWLLRSIDTLAAAGCEPVIVVLGAAADEAAALVMDDPRVRVVVATDWQAGMSASLRAAVAAAGGTDAPALLITLVDLPGLTVGAVARVLGASPATSDLRQAVYEGRVGHPVLVGRDHWSDLAASLSGDEGARAYLTSHRAEQVDCTDLGGGDDVDAL